MSLLNKFIISEIKKVSKKENLNFILKEEKKTPKESCSEHSCSCCQNKDSYIDGIEFEDVNPQEIEQEIEEVKMISEELKRMKEILSFNNPFLR